MKHKYPFLYVVTKEDSDYNKVECYKVVIAEYDFAAITEKIDDLPIDRTMEIHPSKIIEVHIFESKVDALNFVRDWWSK